jgi:UDP-3-O-[3-hydroxymyristoyl] N-acetylglucosamine deacetylase/3-hydroxyacyl-[acyl-carrier-protein] dehydratase
MNIKQRTIKAPVSVSGTGLHTGERVTLTFNPAPENHGYKFRRIDIAGMPIIDADVDNVTDTSRGTTISQNGASLSWLRN